MPQGLSFHGVRASTWKLQWFVRTKGRKQVNTENPMVKAQGINLSLGGSQIITDFTMSIPRGQVYGFLGRNGAGKSTVMKILLGLLKPQSGTLFLGGSPVNPKDSRYLARIGSLIEEPSFYPSLTGAENIRYLSKVRQVPSEEQQLLDMVGLGPHANKKASQYSLGMKQRLGIALALVGDPEILLLDEPTNGLDPEGIREIRQLIQGFARDMGKTVVVSSHILSEIEQMADTVGIIHQGRMCFEGQLSELAGTSSLRLDTLDQHYATAVLDRAKLPYVMDGHGLALPHRDRAESAQLLTWLVNNNVQVASLSAHQRTLEDAFLELTGEKTLVGL